MGTQSLFIFARLSIYRFALLRGQFGPERLGVRATCPPL